jgi:hypothetical protein
VRDGRVDAFGDSQMTRDLAQHGCDSHADMEGFSPRPQTRPEQSRSRVEPYAGFVDSWLRGSRYAAQAASVTQRAYGRLIAQQGLLARIRRCSAG